MKTPLQFVIAVLLLAFLGSGCTTAYDAYGRPRQVVAPEAAVAAAVAAGVIGYAIANNNRGNNYRHDNYRHDNYRQSNYRYGGYGGRGGDCRR